MPRIGMVLGMTIRMYAADHNPPHVHVTGSRDEALVSIQFGNVIKGALTGPEAAAVGAWILDNQAMLFAKWTELQS
jgi:hypothetical protein